MHSVIECYRPMELLKCSPSKPARLHVICCLLAASFSGAGPSIMATRSSYAAKSFHKYTLHCLGLLCTRRRGAQAQRSTYDAQGSRGKDWLNGLNCSASTSPPNEWHSGFVRITPCLKLGGLICVSSPYISIGRSTGPASCNYRFLSTARFINIYRRRPFSQNTADSLHNHPRCPGQ